MHLTESEIKPLSVLMYGSTCTVYMGTSEFCTATVCMLYECKVYNVYDDLKMRPQPTLWRLDEPLV